MKKTVIIALSALLLGFAGCKPDEEEPKPDLPQEISDMTVTINHKLGAEDLDFVSTFTLPSQETVSFGRYAYILSEFYLTTMDDTKVSLGKQYAYIQVNGDKTSFTLKNVPMGNYKSLGLSIGLASATNHGNPNVYMSEHPLAPINNSLYWNYNLH